MASDGLYGIISTCSTILTPSSAGLINNGKRFVMPFTWLCIMLWVNNFIFTFWKQLHKIFFISEFASILRISYSSGISSSSRSSRSSSSNNDSSTWTWLATRTSELISSPAFFWRNCCLPVNRPFYVLPNTRSNVHSLVWSPLYIANI